MTRSETFLDVFFGAGNAITRHQVAASTELQGLVGDLDDTLSAPVILPRRTAASGEVDWYVLCGDDLTLRWVRDDLQGFIGPTYARWDQLRAPLATTDSVEAAVLAFTDGRVLRFRTSTDPEFKSCWAALILMKAVWRQRPRHASIRVQTGSAILNAFEMALAAGDTEAAKERLEELRGRGLLGAENLRFLEIRLQAGEGRWREIAGAADLQDLVRIRRPWLVTEDLLTALYLTHVAQFERAADVASAVGAVGRIADWLPELLAARGPLHSSSVVKLFAVRCALPGREDTAEIERLRDLLEDAPSRDWASSLVDWLRPAASVAPREARLALAAGDIDTAYRLALLEASTASRAELLVECAVELQTLESAAQALDALDSLDATELRTLLDRRLFAIAVAAIRELATAAPAPAGAVPTAWAAWFERLLADSAWTGAEAVAVCGELEFQSSDVIDPPAAERLADLILAAADSDRTQAFRDALPRIVRWLERQDPDPSIARPIHAAILTVLALDTAWGEASLEVAYSSTEVLLSAGPDAAGYVELLEQLALLWGRMNARAHIAWLADLLELLELHPGPRGLLAGFAAATAGATIPFIDRTDPAIVEALAGSLAAIGAQDLATSLLARLDSRDEPGRSGEADVLSGRLVGIHTLTPQVGIRARQAIERRFPGVRVELDSSHVSSAALEHLAATADYLLVSIRSAKHAATDAIDRHRPPGLPTIFPRGRGSTRIVEALIAAVDTP